MRNTPVWWLIIAIMILIDIYVFFAARTVLGEPTQRGKNIYAITYWSISAIALVILLLLPYFQISNSNKLFRSTVFAVLFALFFAKILAAFFFFADDIRRSVQWMAGKLFSTNNEISEVAGVTGDHISRSSFLTWLGIAAGGGIFSTFVYGLSNKYNYEVNKVNLSFENLPAAFKGLKIVHISDIHCGSFTNMKAVSKGVDKILAEKPDVILFTGDLVNNTSDEVGEECQRIFSRLRAPMGVYSTLGNHDYGDYSAWDTPELKKENLDKLISIHAAMGWRLLMDEHIPLQKGDESIGIIGVQNISGKARFHSYGSLAKATQGAEKYPFKILMSHDPSHWDKEVNKKYRDIDLTLSGHTHGMQFGVEVPGFRWSPVQYVYTQWAGLYEKEKQKLYINRGYGFIGYPGRVGIMPEITVIQLS